MRSGFEELCAAEPAADTLQDAQLLLLISHRLRRLAEQVNIRPELLRVEAGTLRRYLVRLLRDRGGFEELVAEFEFEEGLSHGHRSA
jgi:hypothetical protein